MAVRSASRKYRIVVAGWVAAGCWLMLCGGRAWGEWEQFPKLTADDAHEGDYFGCSVSVSGNTIVVGAYNDEDAGIRSGSAYVFDTMTVQQLHKLIADDADEADDFGISVSISGNTIVVGAIHSDGEYWNSGAAYVFDASTGEQLTKLAADDGAAGDEFGYSVSVSGSTVVVGSPWDDDEWTDSGSAYVFDAATGEQLHKLTANYTAPHDYFGYSVSVSGNTIVVGAYGDDSYQGSAYMFDATTGLHLPKLKADDADEEDWFGCSVAISGNIAVVGAKGDDDSGSKSGSAYVFDATTGQQLHKLTADDAEEGDFFGYSVSVSGNTIVVGAKADDDAGSGSGSTYVFNAATGQQLQKLTADDGQNGDEFGTSVSVSGEIIIVGAPCDDDAGMNSGSAYEFSKGDADGDGIGDAIDNCPYHYNPDQYDCDNDGIGDVCTIAECDGSASCDDCNGNGVPDGCDIDDGYSEDCQPNGVPDECEVDCNLNGIPDDCDIDDGYSEDCNDNGIPDECDIDDGYSEDCQPNGVPDECETDCNLNGVPDDCDIDDGVSEDCNVNGIPDECDIDSGYSEDCDGNETPDDCQVLYFLDTSPPMTPVGDGFPHMYVITVPPEPGWDAQILIELTARGDLDAQAEFVDVFLNGQIVGSVFGDGAHSCPDDPDVDQIALDAATFNLLVDGGDAEFELVTSPFVDPDLCDDSFITIQVEYQAITDDDCNGNGTPDICDILDGILHDENNNWIPDECEDECPADVNVDGKVDIDDLFAVLAAWGPCVGCPEDIDDSGVVDIDDVFAVLGNWGPCP